VNDKSDQELLVAFARDRSEPCSTELVRRYVDLVYSTALRTVHDPQTAEDASQAVFIALAQHAASVSRKLANGAPLAGWLHLTTRNVVSKMIRAEVRRRAREQEALAMHELSSGDTEWLWDQIAPCLDQALGELPEADRNALLLRFFKRKSAREIASDLGLSEDAAQKRVTRALERLRHRFVAHGILAPAGISGNALSLVLEAQTIQPAPLALAGIVAQSAFTAGITTTSGATAALTKFISPLIMTKAQTVILATVVAALVLPWGIQHAELTTLRSAIKNAPAPIPIKDLQAAAGSVTGASAGGEIARLSALRDNLRVQLDEKKKATRASFYEKTIGPTLLVRGRSVSLNALGFAGNTSPEAALQSSIVSARDGDLAGFIQLALISPGHIDELNQILGSPEQSEHMKKELAEMLQGVVYESSVQVGPDNKTIVDQHEGKRAPDNPRGEVTFEITEKHQINERNVELVVKIVRGNETKTETINLGLTPAGWKQEFML